FLPHNCLQSLRASFHTSILHQNFKAMKRHLHKPKLPVRTIRQSILFHHVVNQLRIIIIPLVILVMCVPAYAQWTILTSGVTNTLRAPYFIDENTGVVVGEPIAPDEAPILKTTDGGVTWVPKVSGTLNALRGVHFIDDNTGYAVGFLGTILKTEDGGETWTTVTSPTTQNLRSIYFPSHDIGYI